MLSTQLVLQSGKAVWWLCSSNKKINKDKDKVKRSFNIANNYLMNGDKKVKNAISVSYAECFDFKNTKKQNRECTWEIYPELLKREYVIVRGQFGI